MSSLHRGRSFCHLYHWWGGESTVLVGSCRNCFRTAEPVYAVLYEIPLSAYTKAERGDFHGSCTQRFYIHGNAKERSPFDDRLAEQEAFCAALPPCEMEIRELEGTDLEAAATGARTEMTQAWETVTEIENEDFRLSFLASDGAAWDAPQENHYFYSNGERQVYHIIIRYYSEAEEGHGSRFRTMLETFSVIDPTSITQPQVNTMTEATSSLSTNGKR